MNHLRMTVLSLALASSALAGPKFYEGNDPPKTSVKALDPARLDRVLAGEFQAKKLVAKNAATGATGFDGLSLEVKQALLMAISMPMNGENDLIVEGKDGTFTAVEVLVEPPDVTFRFSAPRASLYGKAPSREELQKKYGTGPFIDSGATWGNDTLFVVDLALGKLSPEELKAIAGLPFHRMPAEPAGGVARGPGSRAIAIYRQDAAGSRFEVYDAAPEKDRVRFNGSPDAPIPGSTSTLVHELGHAISRAGSRTEFSEYDTAMAELQAATIAFNEGQKKYNADRAEFQRSKDPELKKSLLAQAAAAKDEMTKVQALQKKVAEADAKRKKTLSGGSPLENAYIAKFPLADAPTLYGRTLVSEAFAEGFSLWKTDRAALERATPGAAAWFDANMGK